ncbi:PEP-CTERM sorting domain-containing protein, partial [Spirulina sp. CS-785/01]|uniref:choice-of-anchor W domain-containing protein n=1 Tax=Spirulina sp. CS-785/01 TaxID=3021716 RepID=UPI00232E078D
SMCSLRGCESQPHRSRSVSAGEAVSTHPLSSPTCSEVGESRGSFVEPRPNNSPQITTITSSTLHKRLGFVKELVKGAVGCSDRASIPPILIVGTDFTGGNPMTLRTGLIALSLATVGALAGTSNANAFTLGGHYDGAEFDALGVEIPWAAETRIGRVGDHEINIHDSANDANNRVQANYDDWVSGEAVDFSLTFDSLNNLLTYTVAGVEVSKSEISQDSFSDLYIRSSARVDGASMVVDNLYLEDSTMASAINDISSAACVGSVGCGYFDADYLHIADITGDFTLTGQSTMSWADGSKPKNSQLAYQIKLVEGDNTTESVPEPATLSLLSLGAFGVILRSRRSAA